MTTETKTTYTLVMLNSQGASESTYYLPSKAAVREQIRTWDAKGMTARVWTSDGQSIWDGPALSFK